MKTILIPVDLSPESENALSYAVDFAMSVPEKIQILLLHVFTTTVAFPETAVSLMIADTSGIENSKREALKVIADKYLHATGLKCELITSRGFLEDEIVMVADQYKADYIFMGTKGARGLKAAFFGSNTSGLIAKTSCPVLAIPNHAIFTPLRKIVFASNFTDTDTADFERLLSFANFFKSTIVMLHISEKNEETLDLKVLEFVRNSVKVKTGYSRIEIATAYNKNVEAGLEEELANQQASLLVMAPRRLGFLDNALNRSRTREMVLHTKTPLLALPREKAAAEPVANAALQTETVLY